MVLYRPGRGRPGVATRAAAAADERIPHLASGLRRQLNKVFPDHWSFMLGEVALYSFIVLLLTGTYLSFFFDPSMGEVKYHGGYAPLRGVTMSHAYESTLRISFDVRGGLIIRQIHHWAALLFVAAIVTHMLRIFFTGAFRKPREINWLIGVLLMWLGIIEGFIGYSLPDDGVSGTGLRIADSIVLSIPVVGTWLEYLIFGGVYPGDIVLPRFYIVHVLLIPGLILALVSIHLTLVVVQKHTQFPAPGHSEKTVTGERVLPHYAAKGGGFFLLVFGVLALMGGLAQINPVWLWGPYSPDVVTSGSQPDWYMGFLEGAIRLFPAWETHFRDYTIPAPFWPAVVLPGVLTLMLLAYPFVEARLTNDRVRHNLLQRPRDVPVRTSLGVMAVSFYVVLFLSGGNDVIADKFNISLDAIVWIGRIMLLVVPPTAYAVTYLACLGLEHHDRQLLKEGIETGLIKMTATGEFIEVHQRLGPGKQLPYAGTPVPKKMNTFIRTRRVLGFFYPIAEDKHDEEKVS